VLNYLEMLAKNRSEGPERAAVLHPGPPLGACGCKHRLTKGGEGRETDNQRNDGDGDQRQRRAKRKAEGTLMATKKQKAAARRNIKKAQAALRAKRRGKTHTKSPRKRSKVAKAHHKKAHHKRKGGKRRSSKRRGGKKRKGGGGSRTTHTRTEIIRLPGHSTKIAVLPIQSGGRRGGGGHKRRKKGKRRSKARETTYERGYAMENPLNGVEIFVGGLTGLLGFGTADVLDRFLATHALTDKNAKDAKGNELYADNVPTDGSYKGLFNATAVLAPMDWKRWGAGAAIAAVPIILANWVRAPVGRSALQFFGFGAGIRVVGKGLQDLFGMVFKTTSFGQRLYDGEMRAAALKAGDGSETSLPSSGLGYADTGCGACANCVTGVGACCGRSMAPVASAPYTPPPQGQPPMYTPPQGGQGGGGGGETPTPSSPPSQYVPPSYNPPSSSPPSSYNPPSSSPPSQYAPPSSYVPQGNPPTTSRIPPSALVPQGGGFAGVPERRSRYDWANNN
jgi:hypothetical protein